MYGRMLTGWITAAGENISDDSDWATATYYGDSEGDGSLVTNAWVYISVKDDDNEDDNEPTYHSTSLPTVRRPSAQRRPSAM